MKKLYEEASVQDIANAIREKNGEATTYKIGEMGAAVRGITTGTPTEVYTFDQRRDEVKRFLQNVIYDPSDYTTSQIQNYVTTPSTNRPVGATITVKSAGTLTVASSSRASLSRPAIAE